MLTAQHDPEFLAFKDQAATITPHAVEGRYPEFEEPALEDAREAVAFAGRVREAVIGKLPLAVRGTHTTS